MNRWVQFGSWIYSLQVEKEFKLKYLFTLLPFSLFCLRPCCFGTESKCWFLRSYIVCSIASEIYRQIWNIINKTLFSTCEFAHMLPLKTAFSFFIFPCEAQINPKNWTNKKHLKALEISYDEGFRMRGY